MPLADTEDLTQVLFHRGFNLLLIRSIFREFVVALEGKTVEIKETNITGLEQLCAEFGFEQLSSKLSKFLEPPKDS
jgi:hypothetical protein